MDVGIFDPDGKKNNPLNFTNNKKDLRVYKKQLNMKFCVK